MSLFFVALPFEYEPNKIIEIILEDFIEFVNLQESQARSMPIFLEYAGKYTAVAWQSCSFRRHFCAIGNEGFDIEKRFLLDIIEEKALAQGKS